MIRLLAPLAGIASLGVAVLLTGSERGEARDFGQLGQTYPVVEADLLSTIETRLFSSSRNSGEKRAMGSHNPFRPSLGKTDSRSANESGSAARPPGEPASGRSRPALGQAQKTQHIAA